MTEETEPKLRLNMSNCYNKVSHISQQEYEELYKRCDSATRRRLTLCYKQVTLTRVPQSAASKRASVVNFALGSLYGAKQQCAAAVAALKAEMAAGGSLEKHVNLSQMALEFAQLADAILAGIGEVESRAARLTELRKQK